MRFKRLDIFGFKSFAKKTTIHFEPGVTALVGPNGSGKSNIVDSIRWVLGEHNPRDVRAPRLEDVIFNGTDRHAPLSMAEVELTISNERGLLPISFAEVTLTRRVYRSGESECLINHSPCRLKDIQELLLGTGLGGATYAIIEQGHIDLVLSSKPEERRIVFEEASGIAKYLAKKQETVRRLDEVEEHLVRIADVTGEVRRQVSALERAANRARQYKSQWDQLKQYELRLAVDELTHGAARAQELDAQLRALATRRSELEAEKQRCMASLESCNATVSTIQQQVQQVRTRAVECASQIEQHLSESTLKQQWVEALQQQAATLEQEQAHLRARVDEIAEQAARVSGGETELQHQLAGAQQHLAGSGDELASLDTEIRRVLEVVEQAKAQVLETATAAASARNHLAQANAERQQLESRLGRLEEQRVQWATTIDEVKTRYAVALERRDSLRTQAAEVQQRVTIGQQALESAGARRHEFTGRLHQLREQLASERAQTKLLEDLWRRFEGFPETIKTIMSAGVDGVIGPLVDVIQALPGYEELVEIALGPLADALVVKDRPALAQCRQLLSAQQLESCRFLVLADCPDQTREPPASANPAMASAVTQYVRADAVYQPLIHWLLNDSWVVEDITRLLESATLPENRIVSLHGDRWDRRSWRFGGSRRSSVQQRLGRRQRWERSRAGLQVLEDDVADVAAQTRGAEQAWQGLLSEQESRKSESTQVATALERLEAQLEQLGEQAKRVEQDQQACGFEVQQLTSERDQLTAVLVGAQQAVAQAQHRQQAAEQRLAAAHLERETAQQGRQQLLLARTQTEATLQALTERLVTLHTRAQEIEAERAQLDQQIQAKAQQREESVRRCTELERQRATHDEQRGQLEQDRVRLAQELDAIQQTLQTEEAQRDQWLPQLLAVEQQLSMVDRQIQEQTQQLSERTFRRIRLVERLQELYQVSEAELDAEQHAAPATLSDDQRGLMIEQVKKLRAKLEGIGPVSLGSVDEYDELKRRLEFLQIQQQDLVQARDDLKASIAQINRTARTQFRDMFDRIRQEFQQYFTRLFHGGEADLTLLDDNNVLESGIDIVARPPGKRLQSITLLSGGERALTAIALLFALFKVRPSPFCILDEIDAPLDEANVDRFTRVLGEFLELSQFILITHNKKTITKADSLYGVTMEEAGISKILSAKLSAGTSGARPMDRQPDSLPAKPAIAASPAEPTAPTDVRSPSDSVSS